jgi:ABC-type lipoprotein export system ATPase subunit
MVTHEQDIATYAQRNVVMRDGLILEDRAVAQRANAAKQLENGRARPPGAPEAASML